MIVASASDRRAGTEQERRMSTMEPGREADGSPQPRRPRGNARRGRIIAATVSAGAVVALTTAIALNEGSASGTPASGSNSSTGSSSAGSGTDQGGSGYQPASPSVNPDFGGDNFGNDGFGSSGTNNDGNSAGNGTSSGNGFSPNTRSGGS
jgi:hypothetical protein